MNKTILARGSRKYEPTPREWACVALLVFLLALAAYVDDAGFYARQAQAQQQMKEAGAWVMW